MKASTKAERLERFRAVIMKADHDTLCHVEHMMEATTSAPKRDRPSALLSWVAHHEPSVLATVARRLSGVRS